MKNSPSGFRNRTALVVVETNRLLAPWNEALLSLLSLLKASLDPSDLEFPLLHGLIRSSIEPLIFQPLGLKAVFGLRMFS